MQFPELDFPSETGCWVPKQKVQKWEGWLGCPISSYTAGFTHRPPGKACSVLHYASCSFSTHSYNIITKYRTHSTLNLQIKHFKLRKNTNITFKNLHFSMSHYNSMRTLLHILNKYYHCYQLNNQMNKKNVVGREIPPKPILEISLVLTKIITVYIFKSK